MATQDTSGMTPPPGFDVKPSGKERALGVVGAVLNHGRPGFDQTPLGKKIASIHSSRLNEAAMHHQNMATYAGILTTGIDPQTGQPLTDQQKQQYTDWYNAAKAAFVKSGGIDKDTKAAVGKAATFADAIIAHGQRSRQNQSQNGAGAGAADADGGGIPGGGVGLTPPPKASADQAQESAQQTPSASAPYDSKAQADAPRLRQQMESNTAFADWKRQQDLLHEHKMEELRATAQAKAQLGARPRPVHSGSVSVLDARDLAAQGKVFMGEDGQPLDLSKLDDNMGLYGMVVRNDEGKWETQYTPFSPNQRTVTVGNESFAISPMDVQRLTQGAGTDLGVHNVPRTGTHQVITLGPGGEPIPSTLTTTSTPSTPGVKGRGTTSPPAPSGAASAPGGITPPPASSASPASKQRTAAPTGAKAPTRGGIRGLPPGTYNQLLQRVTPPRLAATQLFGDPDNPSFKPLASYASIMDDPAARDRVATAWNLIRDHMDQAGANQESHGDLVNIMRNYFGTPGAVAESEVAKMQETLDALKPREAEMLNRLFSTYGTIIGLRSLTKGSAARFSARNMEQEVPVPSMNVRNSRQFYDKLSTLAEEVSNGFKGIPDMMLTPGEREYDLKQQQELQRLASGGKKSSGKLTAPPSSTTGPMTVDEFKRKHQIP